MRYLILLLTFFLFSIVSKANENILPSAKVTDSILFKADVGNLSASEKESLYPANLIDVYPVSYTHLTLPTKA